MKEYEKSNEIREVAIKRIRHTEYKRLLKSGEDRVKRQMYSRMLMTYLCDKLGIETPLVIVTDKPQPKKYGHTLYALYVFSGCKIIIYNTTQKGNVVTMDFFINTLLHEFMHHYDRVYLNIKSTPHCSGFFSRIKDLRKKLDNYATK